MDELLKRAKAAHDNPRFRLSEFEPLIAELRAAGEQVAAAAEQAASDSVDFALGRSDRDEAASKAERAKRDAAALAAAAEALTAKHAQRLTSDRHQAAEAERQAAIAERDELAVEFDTTVRPLLISLPDLLTRVEANAKRLKRAGLREPNAEAKARGIKGHYGVDWFTQLKIPSWTGKGRAWPPVAKRHDAHAIILESDRKIAEGRAAEREAKWGHYRVTAAEFGGTSFKARDSSDGHTETVETIYDGVWTGQIAHAEAARLRRLGATVEAIEPAPAEELQT